MLDSLHDPYINRKNIWLVVYMLTSWSGSLPDQVPIGTSTATNHYPLISVGYGSVSVLQVTIEDDPALFPGDVAV